MKTHKTILFLLVLTMTLTANSQVINWNTTKNWKIYEVDEMKGFQYSADSLKYYKSIELGDVQTKDFLKAMTVLPKDKNYTWMGLYVASYNDTEGNVRKIVFSTYGGFIYDPVSKLYYELPVNYRKDWISFLADKAAELTSK